MPPTITNNPKTIWKVDFSELYLNLLWFLIFDIYKFNSLNSFTSSDDKFIGLHTIFININGLVSLFDKVVCQGWKLGISRTAVNRESSYYIYNFGVFMFMTIVKAQAIHKIYDNDVEAVRGIDLTIKKGEIFGMLGPNGAGKSTTIKMIIGILSPTSGKLEIMGKEMNISNLSELSDHVGYVPQELVYYDHLTVRENLDLFASGFKMNAKDERIQYLLDLLEMKELENRRADQMSGGQKRRLNLAIGLLQKPKLLVLDEPAAGMDPQSRNILWESIEHMAKEEGITIILTTHLMETVDRLSDRVAIIDKGEIKVIGTPQELKDMYGSGDTIEFEFDPTLDEEMLIKIVKHIQSSTDILVHGHCIKTLATDGVMAIGDLVAKITSKFDKSVIAKITMHENTLEDVFIHITGRELRE